MAASTLDHSTVTSLSSVRRQRLDVQLRQLEFHALLHRKLDLERLFECLFSEGQAFVAFDGLCYRAPLSGADIAVGAARPHHQHFELRLGERGLGEVILMRAEPFSSREEREAERLLESLVYPLDNALVHHAALMRTMTDESTGLGNERALERQLSRELRLAARTGRTPAVLLARVDCLETLGERCGDAVGAEARQRIASTLRSWLRESDLVFRTDDDVFCVVLDDAESEGALALAERLREEIRRCLSLDNVRFVLTTSIGVALAARSDDVVALLARAREALDEARERGRGRICVIDASDGRPDEGPPAA